MQRTVQFKGRKCFGHTTKDFVLLCRSKCAPVGGEKRSGRSRSRCMSEWESERMTEWVNECPSASSQICGSCLVTVGCAVYQRLKRLIYSQQTEKGFLWLRQGRSSTLAQRQRAIVCCATHADNSLIDKQLQSYWAPGLRLQWQLC